MKDFVYDSGVRIFYGAGQMETIAISPKFSVCLWKQKQTNRFCRKRWLHLKHFIRNFALPLPMESLPPIRRATRSWSGSSTPSVTCHGNPSRDQGHKRYHAESVGKENAGVHPSRRCYCRKLCRDDPAALSGHPGWRERVIR